MPKGNEMTNFYAHGGHVGADPRKRDALRHRSAIQPQSRHHDSPAHLRYFAEQLRHQGTGGDNILAHINPEEARELALLHGYSLNPETGLPEFGFWDKLKKFLPAIGGLLGSIVFPGLAPAASWLGASPVISSTLGGALGGTLGGAIENPEAPFRGTLTGAGVGLGKGILGPMMVAGAPAGAGAAAGQLGAHAGRAAAFQSLMHSAQVPGVAGALNSVGGSMMPYLTGTALSSIPSMMGGNQRPQQPMQPQQPGIQQPQQPGQPGLMGALGRGIGGIGNYVMQNPLQAALLGTGLYGTIHEGIRASKHKEKSHYQRMNELNPYAPENYRRSRTGRRRVLRPGDEGYDPENRYYADINPEPEYYAGGGYVDGDSGGQDDDVDADLTPGDYIMDATTVSLAGDGNSKAGDKKIDKELLDKFSEGGITREHKYSHKMRHLDMNPIKARLSHGEKRIPASKVAAIGKGDPVKGAKVLDKFRSNLRKHKGVKKFLPPKSKPLTAYMR